MRKWMLGAVLLCLAGCGMKGRYPEFLIEKEWVYEDMICSQKMRFSEDGEYFYSCACGEPVGDSDLYDSYSYDAATNVITLHPCERGFGEKRIEILVQEEDSILLNVDGAVKEFYADMDVPVLSEYTDYLEGYSAYRTLFEMKDGVWVTGPMDYDGDIAEDKERLREDKVASKVEFYELQIETIETSEETISTHTYRQLTKEEALYNPDNSYDSGFVWYNENAEIEKVLIYGEIIIYE